MESQCNNRFHNRCNRLVSVKGICYPQDTPGEEREPSTTRARLSPSKQKEPTEGYDLKDTPIPQRPRTPIFNETPGPLDALVQQLHERFPGVPLTALGQTIFWDEPMKAVLLDALHAHAPGTALRLSVMDTDYFAKPPLETEGHGEYVILPHNDTTTKDLWIATGELSRLFGSETVPSREMYREHGIQLERVARESRETRHRFLDRVTEAWGWRGLAFSGSRRTLAGEIPLSGALPALLDQLRWGFMETADALADPEARKLARAVAEGWLESVRQFAAEHPDASLTDLYRHLLPRFTASLQRCLPEEQAGLETGGSLEEFRFNRETAGDPRFELLDLFLRPDTAEGAKDAYNDAVRGSDIYTLDRFSMGAIPFDLVIPGRGRGTIRIIPERVIIEMEERVYLRIDRPIQSVHDLADAVESHLGGRVSLVGKALTLIAMLARCGLVVLNETGSNYVWRTRNMIEGLCDKGVRLPLYPIVRLRYPTWEHITVAGDALRLPDHLAWGFGAETVSTETFAERWRDVCRKQRDLLDEAKAAVGPREAMEFLAQWGGPEWRERREAFDESQDLLLSLRMRLSEIKSEVRQLVEETRQLKARCEGLAREKGEDYRRSVQPLREQLRERGVPAPSSLNEGESDLVRPLTGERVAVEDPPAVQALLDRLHAEMDRRREFDRRWESLRSEIHNREIRMRELDRERVALLREDRVQQARRRSMELATQAQAAKLEIVRNAYLCAEGLEHTEHRPSAWWLLLLDPDGTWFREIRKGTEAYLEPLSCCLPKPSSSPASPLRGQG